MRTCPKCQKTYPDDMAYCPRDAAALVEAGGWNDGAVVRGKYRILCKLGQGGMGAVYKAVHLRFNEVRALKVMSPQVAGDPLFVKRFEQEAVLTRKLQHPNAVRVDDIDESDDGRPFIVMEFIEGKSLKHVIEQEGPLPAPRVCAIVKQVAAALGAAHELGMVHRDIKPDNIVLVTPNVAPGFSPAPSSEIAKVLDFGIAKLKEARAAETAGLTLTGTGVVIGTPQYMSPEQAAGKRGDELDARADLYSLGIVMYQMLSGELPFKANTTIEMLMAHMQEPPRPIRTVRANLQISEAVASVVMHCLEKKPEQRPASAQRLIAEIEAAEKLPPLDATRAVGRDPAYSPQESARALREALQNKKQEIGRGTALPDVPPAKPDSQAAPRPAPPPGRQFLPPSAPGIPGLARAKPGLQPKKSRVAVWVTVSVFVLALAVGYVWIVGRNSPQPKPPPINPPVSNPAREATNPKSVENPGTGVQTLPAPLAPQNPGNSPAGSPRLREQIAAAKREGDHYYDLGKYDEAINAYQRALKLDSSNAGLRKALQRAQTAKAAEEKFNQ